MQLRRLIPLRSAALQRKERQVANNGYDTICQIALEQGARIAKIVPIDTIVVAPWVQWKCRFGCPRHGKSKTCPPFAPDHAETKRILDSYSSSLLIEGEPPSKQFNGMVVEIENKANLLGYYKAFAMVAGPCPICNECDVTKPCSFPSLARPSMEACGIDVFQTVRNNGLSVQFLKHKGEYVRYFGLVMIE